MKDLINYLVPRTLVLATIALMLKCTVWPTMSFPLPITNCFEPVWHVATTIKRSVTEPTTRRFHSATAETIAPHKVVAQAGSAPFTIEICPAGSEPTKVATPINAIANRPDGVSALGASAAAKSSRVATSKRP